MKKLARRNRNHYEHRQDFESDFNNWYPLTKEVPIYIGRDGLEKAPILKTSHHLQHRYFDFTKETISDWIETGTIQLMNEDEEVIMASPAVYASMTS